MKENVIHSVDFGLAKPYLDSETNRHVPFAEHRSITGDYLSENIFYHKICSRHGALHVRARAPRDRAEPAGRHGEHRIPPRLLHEGRETALDGAQDGA